VVDLVRIDGSVSPDSTITIGADKGLVTEGLEIQESTVASVSNSGEIDRGIAIYDALIDGDVVNGADGEIVSDFVGIFLQADTTVTGDVINAGVIGSAGNTGAAGIVVAFESQITGSIVNTATATIEAESTGIVVLGSSVGNVTNAGLISAETGIYVFDDSLVTGSIDNSGDINADIGIEIDEAVIEGHIINQESGEIDVVWKGITINASEVASVTNAGTLTAGDGGIGIYVEGESSIGVITNAATGTITATDFGSSSGVGILIDESSVGSVVNLGTITASIAVSLEGTEGTILNNSGTLNGEVMLGGNTFEVSGGEVNGDVSGGVGSEINFSGDFETAGDFEADAININNGATLILKHTLREAAEEVGTVTSSGIVYVPDGEIGTIDDSYVQTADGTLRIGLSSATSFGQLVVTDSATFTSGANIDVDVTQASGLANGTVDDIVTADSIDSDGSFTVTDNSALFDFTAVLDNNTLDLDIERVLMVENVVRMLPSSIPSIGAAKVIDALITDGVTDQGLQDFITVLGQFETNAEIADAVDEVLPLFTGNQQMVLANTAGEVGRVIRQRLQATLGPSGLSSGDSVDGQHQLGEDAYLWVKAFGSRADQDDRRAVSGFEADIYGLALGVDALINDHYRLGVAFSTTEADLDRNDNQHNTEISSYQLTAYGSIETEDNIQFGYQLSYAVHDNDGERQIDFLNLQVDSDYDSESFGVELDVAHHYKLNDQLGFSPVFYTNYLRINNDEYTETGAGSLNLIVDDNDAEAWFVGVDGTFTYALDDKVGLSGSLGVAYDMINEQSQLSSAFVGSSSGVFVTEGLNPDAMEYRAGAGLHVDTEQGVKLGLVYDYVTRNDYDNHSVSLKARWAF
jgi:uncharacterized protein with beta-barrel porin domain